MTQVLYDGSYEGLLTAFFEVYEYKLKEVTIVKNGQANQALFGTTHEVTTQPEKAQRVLAKLTEKLSREGLANFFIVYLSEHPNIENVLLRYLQYLLQSKTSIEHNFSHPDVLFIQQQVRKVQRERHRMKAFVRFKKTRDSLYYAIIQPDYNVLPLIGNHFKERYADQRWLIYDAQRKYGLYYDRHKVEEIEMDFAVALNNEKDMHAIHDESEELYQKLWQQYFSSVNIAARKNMKLHLQHVPKRYWKFLSEKVPAISVR